jgi:hypothetical protein
MLNRSWKTLTLEHGARDEYDGAIPGGGSGSTVTLYTNLLFRKSDLNWLVPIMKLKYTSQEN